MTIPHPDAKILVFSKAPQAGHVKTRLMPDYSAEQAATIHTRLVQHTLTTLYRARLCPIELWCAPDTQHPFFENCRHKYQIELKQQQGCDLGARMCHAFRSALQTAKQVILIGTDCPTLVKRDFQQAIKMLTQPIDAVISPANDGGYVLIGLTRCHQQLFSNIRWGKDQVMQETLERIKQLNYAHKILPPHNDIDYAQDIQNLPASLRKNLIAHL